MLDRNYLFSIVMPVYNTGVFLAEAIDSIVDQTIGFEENIQLILVNDGSTDSSGSVCEMYASRYPRNIVYIEKENGGVSSARNVGMLQAKGLFVNFFDSDDKWSLDAFELFDSFLKRNPGVGIATARHEFFGAKSGKHPLSYKYEEERVIDVFEVADCPHLSFSNAVVSRGLLEGLKFDERLKVSEDFLVFNKLLLEEREIAFLDGPIYWYRKRGDGSSAIDSSHSNKSWYLDTPKLCYEELFALSKQRYGYVIPYIQYAVMYDLQWRLKSCFESPLDDEEFAQYKTLCLGLLKEINPEIICAQRNLNRAQKIAILAFRSECEVGELLDRLFVLKSRLYLGGCGKYGSFSTGLWGLKTEAALTLHFLEFEANGCMTIEGSLATVLPEGMIDLGVVCDGKTYKTVLFERPDADNETFFGDICHARIGFKVSIPKSSFSFTCRVMGGYVQPRLSTSWTFPVSGLKNSYCWRNGVSITRSGDKFIVKKRSNTWRLKREYLYQKTIAPKSPEAAKLRRAILFNDTFCKGDRVWLISDRPHMAGDNGEALFSYIQEHPIEGVKAVFCLEETSPDYARLKGIGPVVPYWSLEHRLAFLKAEKNISSAADKFVQNPFGDDYEYVKDLVRSDFVFLQHGVTKDDMSSWLKRWNKDIKLLCCASIREQQSFVENEKYGYSDAVVKLTGFARHDKLINAKEPSKKRLLIAPTWRKYLAGELEPSTGKFLRNPAFKESDYFAFYSKLLNDAQIALALEAQGFETHFLLHPAFLNNLGDFSSSYAQIQSEYNYAKEFVESSIMITDYSSVAFDFAILKKSLLYAQFDKERFYETQWDRGYFDYEADGFGPVCLDYDSLKENLLHILENPAMDSEYSGRVDSFFGPLDGKACERILNELRNMSNVR